MLFFFNKSHCVASISCTEAASFGCTNGDFYVALGSSIGLALLVWVGGGLYILMMSLVKVENLRFGT